MEWRVTCSFFLFYSILINLVTDIKEYVVHYVLYWILNMRSTYNLLQAARETGALKEAKDKLEKHVEELTWRLQLEKRLRVILMF